MEIIKDKQKQLNLHPLVIYFILSSNESEVRAEALKRINKYKGFTRKLFKFQTIEYNGKHSEDVSSKLDDAIKHNNMLVRLVDDNSDSFCYAVNKVNFNLSGDEVERSIRNFVVDVCRQNIKNLETRALEYKQQGVSREKLIAIRRLQNSFNVAISLKRYKRGTWSRLMSDTVVLRVSAESMIRHNRVLNMPEGFIDKFNTAAKNDDPQYLWTWIESMIGAPCKEESDEIAKGYYNEKYAHYLKRDQRRRIQPKEMPTISVEIKHIVKTVLKSGREKREYGFVFMVNDEIFPICFGSKDQTMLYACILIRQKMGEKMYLHEFFNNSKGNSRKVRFRREQSNGWLEAVYNTIFPGDSRDFDDWIGKVREKHGRPLNQGKSQSSKRIEEALNSLSSAIYFCSINTKEDEIGDSYYEINIPSDVITIPDNMLFLIEEFDNLMGLKI